MTEVSNNIKKYRKIANFTQSELGSLLGKAPSVIANWEAGTNRPDVDSIRKMCEIFKITPNDFFSFNEEVDVLYARREDGHIMTDFDKLPQDAQDKILEYYEMIKHKYLDN